MDTSDAAAPGNPRKSGKTARQEITPALVRIVGEKVYALLLQDLKLARERMGLHRGTGFDHLYSAQSSRRGR